jgi:hypothetical protein
MSTCTDTMLPPPLGFVKVNANVCVVPLPEFGDTDTGAGGPLLVVMFNVAVVL